jgi:hypothetical protein
MCYIGESLQEPVQPSLFQLGVVVVVQVVHASQVVTFSGQDLGHMKADKTGVPGQ